MDDATLNNTIIKVAMERARENGGPLIGMVMVAEVGLYDGKVGVLFRKRPFDIPKYFVDSGIIITDAGAIKKLHYKIDDANLTDLPVLTVFTRKNDHGGAEYECGVAVLRGRAI